MKDLTIEELKAREAAILRGIAGRLGPSNPSTMPEGAVNPQAPVWHGDEEKPSTLPSPESIPQIGDSSSEEERRRGILSRHSAVPFPLPLVSRESKPGSLAELVPEELLSEYQTNATVQAIFQFAALKGQSREGALITIAKVALETIGRQTALLTKAFAEQTMVEPLSDEEIKSLLRAALSWRAQGSAGTTTHWTTPRSRNLAIVIDRLRAEHPTLCMALAPAGLVAPEDRDPVVHLLLGGQALCGKPGLPGEWEPGHRWVSAVNDDHGPREAANCPACLAAAP